MQAALKSQTARATMRLYVVRLAVPDCMLAPLNEGSRKTFGTAVIAAPTGDDALDLARGWAHRNQWVWKAGDIVVERIARRSLMKKTRIVCAEPVTLR